MRRLTDAEQPLILPLLGSCFPDYWEQLALANGKMPFNEISFAEFDGSKVIGHCGIIPYEIFCQGKIYRMGGIASVAVDPAYRHRGIARNLCQYAFQWAKNEGFASLPLYTARFRVYESCDWRILDVPQTRQFSQLPAAAVPRIPGNQLTEAEKNSIISLYDSSPVFDGKVIRHDSGTLHSWERIFAEPEFTFSLIPGGCAIISGGVIIEANFADGIRREAVAELFGNTPFYLPRTPEVPAGTACNIADTDAMHGEKPMVRDAVLPDFHRKHRIFFPVTDKF